jgi:hypothetical protein
MWATASSSESTTPTARSSERYSAAQSSSVTGTATGRTPAPLVGVQHDALGLERLDGPRQERLGDVGVHEQRLGGVADARAVRLAVDGDGDGLVEVGGRRRRRRCSCRRRSR